MTLVGGATSNKADGAFETVVSQEATAKSLGTCEDLTIRDANTSQTNDPG